MFLEMDSFKTGFCFGVFLLCSHSLVTLLYKEAENVLTSDMALVFFVIVEYFCSKARMALMQFSYPEDTDFSVLLHTTRIPHQGILIK